MARTYQISNGIIFCVNDDGSITKYATINENGDICKIGDKIQKISPQKTWKSMSVIVLLLIGVTTLGILYYNAWEDYQSQIDKTYSIDRKYQESQKRISDLQIEKQELVHQKESIEEALRSLKQIVGGSYPLIISDIEIANTYKGGDVETDYGRTIYSSNTMFLKPRITYYGIQSGTKTLKVKWYNPDGSIRTGSSSPYGFSQSDDHYISSGANNTLTLRGWGYENKGHWSSGTYRIEIWYETTCLKSKTFYIH